MTHYGEAPGRSRVSTIALLWRQKLRNYSLGKCGTELSLEERNPKEQGRDEIEVVDIDTNAPSRAFGE